MRDQPEGSAGADRDVDLYRLVVENLEDYAILVLDTSRRVLTWNRGAERLLGYTAEEMRGHSADRIFTTEDIAANAPEAEAREALATGRAEDNRWHVRKDGSRFWASGVMNRLDDGSGGARGLAKILRDQTALKLAEQDRDQAEEALRVSELRFRRLIEANIIGVGISSNSGDWIDGNDELLRILGCSREELRAGEVRWDRMTPEEYLPLDERGIAEANERGACSPYEKQYVRKDGRRVPVLIGYARVSGVESHYVCFVLDLSPQKQIEQALREADRRKDEFLAMLAHELRNPLSAIANGVDLLETPALDEDDRSWARQVIARQVRHLSRLIDDLLDVSRVSRGKIELKAQHIDATSVVRHALDTVQPLMSERKHKLAVSYDSAELELKADPTRLEQIVVNLLTNAAKYTESGGHIWLGASREDDEIVITVRDDGIGIPPEQLPQMFELFAQGDRSLARSEGGLGIGLTLVKALTEMHGGTVTARSEGPGRGSEFSIRLPAVRQRPAARTEAGPPGTGQAAGRRRILIVDDNTDTARGMARLLKLVGHEVEAAHNGTEGLEAARRFRPEIVLLDIGLPGMDGYQVAQRLRQEHGLEDLSIIAISGYGQDEDRRRSSEAGFDHHLVKPIDHTALLALLT